MPEWWESLTQPPDDVEELRKLIASLAQAKPEAEAAPTPRRGPRKGAEINAMFEPSDADLVKAQAPMGDVFAPEHRPDLRNPQFGASDLDLIQAQAPTGEMDVTSKPAGIADYLNPMRATSPTNIAAQAAISDVLSGRRPPEDINKVTQIANQAQTRQTLGHINSFLDMFDQPRDIVARRFYEATRGEPAGEGRMPSMDAYLGGIVPEATGKDSWPSWIAKTGARFTADAATDPLLLGFGAKGLGAAGKVISKLFPWLPEGETLVGNLVKRTPLPQIADNLYVDTGLNRAFGHTPGSPVAQQIMDRAIWSGNTTRRFTTAEAERIAEELEAAGITKPEQFIDLYHGLERPSEATGTTRDALDLFGDMRGKEHELFEARNALRAERDLPPVADLTAGDYEYMTHQFTGKKPPFLRDTAPAVPAWSTEKPQSRTLYRWVEEGSDADVIPGFVSSADPKYLKQAGIEGNPKTGYTFKGRAIMPEPVVGRGYSRQLTERALDYPEIGPVKPDMEFVDLFAPKGTVDRTINVEPTTQVSLKEILDAPNLGIMPGEVQIHPEQALKTNIERLQKQVSFLEGTKGLEDAGLLTDLVPETGKSDISGLRRAADYITGLAGPREPRQVNVRGLEGKAADPKLADYLENLAHSDYDPTSPMGALHKTLEAIRYSPVGEGVHDLNTWWKRNMLAKVARGFADEVSRWPQLYGQAGMSFPEIASGHADFFKVWKPEMFNDIFEGVPNRALREGFEDRELMGRYLSGQYGPAEVGRGPGFWRSKTPSWALDEQTGTTPMIQFAEKYGDINDLILGGIRRSEEQHKGAAVINWLKKWEKENGSLGELYQGDKGAFDKVLDEAARFGHTTMGDYTSRGTTPTERLLIELDPFYRWHRYILPGGIETALTQPQRLAKLGRLENAILTPPTKEEYDKMPEWAKEMGPVSGAFGKSFDDWMMDLFGTPPGKNPRWFAAGRLNPYQHHAEMVQDPLRMVENKITPWYQMMKEGMTGRTAFTNREIDRIAGGPLASLENSMLGTGPYDFAWDRRFGFPRSQGAAWLESKLPSSRDERDLSELLRGLAYTLGADPKTGVFQDIARPPVSLLQAISEWLTGRREYQFSFGDREPWEQGKTLQAINNAIRTQEKYQHDPEKLARLQEMRDKFMEEHPDALELIGPFPKKKKGSQAASRQAPPRQAEAQPVIDMAPPKTPAGPWRPPESQLADLLEELIAPYETPARPGEGKDERKDRRKSDAQRRQEIIRRLEYYQ